MGTGRSGTTPGGARRPVWRRPTRRTWSLLAAVAVLVVPLTLVGVVGTLEPGVTGLWPLLIALTALACGATATALLRRGVTLPLARQLDATRRRAEDAQLRFDVLLQNTPVALAVFDTAGLCVLATGAPSTGFPADALLGRSCFDGRTFSPQGVQAARSALSGVPARSLSQLRGLTWDVRWEPLTDEAGEVTGVVAAGIDVTERVVAQENLARRVRHLQALATLSQAMGDARLDERAVAQAAVRTGAEQVGEACNVRVVSPDGFTLEPLAAAHRDAGQGALVREMFAQTIVPVGEGFAGHVLRTGQPFVVLDGADGAWRDQVPERLRPWVDRMTVTAFITAPMRVAGRTIGVFSVTRTTGTYDEADVEFVQELSDRVAVGIDAARLFSSVQQESERRQEVADQLADALAEQRRLLVDLSRTEERERRRIAEDIHDDPLQVLVAAQLRLGLARAGAPEPTAGLLERVESTLEDVGTRLRRLIFRLSPPDLDAGLVAALEASARDLFDGTGTQVTVEAAGRAPIADATARTAYRVAREALVNARKHADARHVRVVVAAAPDDVSVRVEDDGTGTAVPLEPRGGHHLGLRSMRERVAAAGGMVRVDSAEGRGTVVQFVLPVTAPADAGAPPAGRLDAPGRSLGEDATVDRPEERGHDDVHDGAAPA